MWGKFTLSSTFHCTLWSKLSVKILSSFNYLFLIYFIYFSMYKSHLPHPVRPNVLHLMNIILSPTSPHPLPSGKKKSQFLIFYKHYLSFKVAPFKHCLSGKQCGSSNWLYATLSLFWMFSFHKKCCRITDYPYIYPVYIIHMSVDVDGFLLCILFISWSNSWFMRQREREREGENTEREREFTGVLLIVC